MSYIYKTKGTCSTEIELDLDGNIVRNDLQVDVTETYKLSLSLSRDLQ